jgi:tRNA-2-methylthio-N6-dimethylallyladenosine synthase
MNERDSEIMAELLERDGLVRARGLEDAGIAVVNTCHVRGHAEHRVLSLLGRLREWKKARDGRLIVLAGCVAEARGQGIRERFPQVDVVMGPARLLELPRIIARARAGDLPQAATGHEGADLVPEIAGRTATGIKAWVKIMEGCDHACAFCVVPRVRGSARHRPFGEIVDEVDRLSQAGVREVTLLGQTVNSYGIREGPEGGFAALLRRLSSIGGLARIRFTSPHPVHMTDSVLRAMAECPTVCKHLHLPVQSGSDRILKLMGRGHTAEFFLKIVERARGMMPGIAVTTDLITGFPGETEEDFASTTALVRAADFTGAFSFAYSERPGTRAAGMPDQVPPEVRRERLGRLNRLLDEASLRSNEKMAGKTAVVFIEGPGGAASAAPRGPGTPSDWTGRLESNVRVTFPPREGLFPGDLEAVEITGWGTWTLTGRLVGAAATRAGMGQ